MNASITISTAGGRIDRVHAGIVAAAWLAIAAATVWGTVSICLNLPGDRDWLPVLPLGYLVAIGWPYVLLRTKTQTLEATEEALLLHGTGIPFKNTIRIPRDRKLVLYLGNDGGWGVITILRLQWGKRAWSVVYLATLAHPTVKLQILSEITLFLTNHGFEVEVKDEYSPTRLIRS